MESYGLDKRHTIGSLATTVWNIIQIQHGSEDLCTGHVSIYMYTVTLTLDIWPLVNVITHTWVMDNNCEKYFPDLVKLCWGMTWTSILGICSLWPWPWRCDLRSRSWHTLGPWTTVLRNIIHIHQAIKKLWPGHGFWLCVHGDFDLGDISLGQGHDTILGYGHELCEILSRSNTAVRNSGQDTDFIYV